MQKRRNLVAVLIIAVHAVGNHDKVNAVLTEEHFAALTEKVQAQQPLTMPQKEFLKENGVDIDVQM